MLLVASKIVPVAETVRFTRMNSGWSGAADARPNEMTEEVDSTLVVRVEEADGEDKRKYVLYLFFCLCGLAWSFDC